MKIYIDIRDDIKPELALECVKRVIEKGRISGNNDKYCWLTTFKTEIGELVVGTRDYRKNDCFVIHKKIKK